MQKHTGAQKCVNEKNHHCMGQRAEAGCSLGSVEAGLGEMLLRKLLRAYGEDGGPRDMESGGESCFRRWMRGEHAVILRVWGRGQAYNDQ